MANPRTIPCWLMQVCATPKGLAAHPNWKSIPDQILIWDRRERDRCVKAAREAMRRGEISLIQMRPHLTPEQDVLMPARTPSRKAGTVACPHAKAVGRVSSHVDLNAASAAGKPTISGYVCDRQSCQQRALARVRTFTGKPGVFVPFSSREGTR